MEISVTEYEKRERTFVGASLRAAKDAPSGHVVEGLAVPYGQVIEYGGSGETFDPDCRFDGAADAKAYYQHDQLIGSITEATSESDGLHVRLAISSTTLGDDVVELLSDGALDSLSVGFVPTEIAIDDDGVFHYRAVRLYEVSLVSWPAYSLAKVTAQRADELKGDAKVSEENIKYASIDDVDALTESVRALKVDVAKAAHPASSAPLGSQFRSSGDYLRKLAAGDAEAAALMRESRDLIVTGDSGNTVTWLADAIKLIAQRRKVAGILSHASLPDTGMTLEYVKLDSDTTQAGAQSYEGATLPFGKVSLIGDSAAVKTYGGYTSLSVQTIERSTTPMLDTALAALRNAYANATEAAVRAHLYAALGTATGVDTAKTPATATIDDWAGLILDAAELADDRNVTIARLGVSKDIMLSLVALKDTSTRYFDLAGTGNETIGSFDLTGIAGSFLRVPVQLLPGAPEGTAAFIDPESITVWESGGPAQLTNGDPTKLTQDYSVYGYAAIGTTNAAGLIPIEFGA